MHLHVVEDDTVFAPDAPERFERILARLPRELPDWDVLFTDVLLGQFALGYRFVQPMLERYRRSRVISIASLKGCAFSATSAYFVNSAKIGKFADLMAGQWATNLPIDMYVRHLVKKGLLVAGVTVPFVTTLSPAHVDSSTRGPLDDTGRVTLLLRRSLYKNANLNQLAAEMDLVFADVPKTPHMDLFMKALGFFMSDRWVYHKRRTWRV